MKKTIIASSALLCTLAIASAVSAQDTTTAVAVAPAPAVTAISNETEIKAVQALVANLQAEHAKLKAAVDAGSMTKADAQAAWKKLVDDARAQKKTVFEKRIADITTRYQKLQQTKPEVAAAVQEKIDALKQKRQEAEAARADIQAKIKAGTITKEQAVEMRKTVVEEGKAKIEEMTKAVKEKRAEVKNQIGTVVAENKAVREDAKAKIDDIKKGFASGTPVLKQEGRTEIKNILTDTKAKLQEGRAKIEAGTRDVLKKQPVAPVVPAAPVQ